MRLLCETETTELNLFMSSNSDTNVCVPRLKLVAASAILNLQTFIDAHCILDSLLTHLNCGPYDFFFNVWTPARILIEQYNFNKHAL